MIWPDPEPDDELPQRIQRSRAKGWRKPDGCIIVDRTTEFGNPFRAVGPVKTLSGPDRGKVEWWVETTASVWRFPTKPEASAAAVDLYRAWLERPAQSQLLAKVALLRGKALACFCRLGAPCHADVLLELANR